MPLQSLLDWLSKPKGPNLVEASVAAVPEKALVLAVSKKMLFQEKPPLVGVGLVYKPHYISPVLFSAAYVQLNVWHSAGSNGESEDKLTASRLLFVSISEMSDVIPVALQHPVLLDVASREAMEETGEPMSPLSFRGFRLYTAWTQQPGGQLTHHITFPHFLGEGSSSTLEYKSENFPQGLKQGQKRVLSLKPLPQTIGILPRTWSSLWPWMNPGDGAKPSGWPQVWKKGLRGQSCLPQRHLLLGSLLNLRQEAVVWLFQ